MSDSTARRRRALSSHRAHYEKVVASDLGLLDEWLQIAPERFRPPHPPDKFIYLPDHVREWIAGKSKSELGRLDKILDIDPDRLDRLAELDTEKLNSIISDFQAAQTIGKAGKWLLVLIGGIFTTAYAAIKMGIDVLGWLKGVGR